MSRTVEIGFVIASDPPSLAGRATAGFESAKAQCAWAEASSIAPLDCFVAALLAMTRLPQQRIEDEGSFLTGRGDRIALGIEAAFRGGILRRAWGRRAVRLRQLRLRCRNGGRPWGRLQRSGPAAGRQRQRR